MKKIIIPLLFLIIFLFISCNSTSSPQPEQYVTYSTPNIPFHYQATNTLCQSAALYMVAEYFASTMGWYNSSFIKPSEYDTQTYINNYLLNNGGRDWYPNSQTGVPSSYSSFLYWHLKTNYTTSAYLMTHTTGDSALAFQTDYIKNCKDPLIVTMQSSVTTYHAVVLYSIKYDTFNKIEKTIYYNDPYAGKNQEQTRDSWKIMTCLSPGGYWLTMSFPNIRKGVKHAK